MFDQQASDNATRFPSAKYWLGPYAIAVSTLFLWGYWGSFHVNVLEFIGIADIVKTAVYPVASAFAFFALGAVLGETLSPTLNLPPGGGVDTKIGRFLHKAFPFLATAYMLGLAYYFLAGPVEKWRVLPVLFAVMVYLPLKSTGLLAQDFKSDGVRSIAVFLLAALPVFAYGRGVLEANDVLAGKSYAYVVSYLPRETLINSRPFACAWDNAIFAGREGHYGCNRVFPNWNMRRRRKSRDETGFCRRSKRSRHGPSWNGQLPRSIRAAVGVVVRRLGYSGCCACT